MPDNRPETPDNPQTGSPFALGLLLRRAHDRVAAAIDEALLPFGFERRHLMVLMRLRADGPLTQRDLVAQTDHDKASIVRIVDDLERLDLASRELVPGDRRLRAVTLTDHGREVLGRARDAARPAEAAATKALSPDQTEQLHHLLRTMIGG
ncbi:MarR family transcriptional regulator [Actinoplanes bogorensis]|uniref:MarR family transcriptional regulator n=1 Tax=Paractinoplanes bogorensis TaxID=1610840 RepID=A0ABS5YGM6_9ACTN|nr:MarR family transcriptional regulator [Actinoplanes bogorensis]MBU2662497.1 MarR family transcriptional regulator [Actinoplanes bogorensis]